MTEKRLLIVYCCFFAFADLFNWKATFNNYSCDRSKDVLKHLVGIDNTEIEFIEKRDKELKYIIERASPYCDKHPKLDEMILYAKDTLEKDNERKEYHTNSLLELEKLRNNFEKERKNSKCFPTS